MNYPKTLLVVNPRATRAKSATRDLIAHALSSVAALEVAQTTHAGHARSLASDAARRGLDLVVALGGDGTVNEVANGLIDVGAETAMAVVPGGGVDVFARSLAIPNDTIEAADLLVNNLQQGLKPHLRAVGFLKDRAFLFNAGVGADAAIVAAVDRHPKRKKRYGDGYFLLQTVKTVAGYRRRQARVDVDVTLLDGSQIQVAGEMVVACLSDPYTYLGKRRLRLCPNANASSGLSLIVIDRVRALRGLRLAAKAFTSARHERMKGVEVLDQVREAKIETASPLPSQADGEIGPTATAHSLSYRPEALWVLA